MKKISGKEKIKPKTIEAKKKINKEMEDKLRTAEELKKSGDLNEAEEICINIISLDQKNISAYHLLGEVYLAKKDYEHAREIFSFLIKLNAQDDKAYENLGVIASSLGNLDEAKQDLIKSININSKIATYHANLAKIYTACDDTKSYKILSGCFELRTK